MIKKTLSHYKCFLDMDGVLVDFVTGISNAHSRYSPYDDPKSWGVFEMEKLWGITPKQFWEPINNDCNFWKHLYKTLEADQIVELVTSKFGESNVAILTSPSEDIDCIPGKKAWMKQYYPQFAKRMFFGSNKGFLAGPNKVLIDDRDKNLEKFHKAGGIAIQVPRLWNSGWDQSDKVIQTLTEELNKL